MIAPVACRHCGIPNSNNHDEDHPGLCCDCFDVSVGAAEHDVINETRRSKGLPQIPPPPFPPPPGRN